MNLTVDLELIKSFRKKWLIAQDLVHLGIFANLAEIYRLRTAGRSLPPAERREVTVQGRSINKLFFDKDEVVKWLEEQRKSIVQRKPFDQPFGKKDTNGIKKGSEEEMAEFLFETTPQYSPLVADNCDDRAMRLSINSHLNEIRTKKDTRE